VLTGVNKSVQSEAKESIFAGSNVTGGTQGEVIIKDNSNIIFAAGESIVLGPGFSVEAGSTFQAYIKDFYCAPANQMNMVSLSGHNNNPETNQDDNNELQIGPPAIDTKILKTNEIRISPNPSDGEFDVYIDRSGWQKAKIQLYNMMGGLIYNDDVIIGQTERVSINNQPAGIYLLKITNDDGQIITEKIIIK
jgi:hypothetical protein